MAEIDFQVTRTQPHWHNVGAFMLCFLGIDTPQTEAIWNFKAIFGLKLKLLSIRIVNKSHVFNGEVSVLTAGGFCNGFVLHGWCGGDCFSSIYFRIDNDKWNFILFIQRIREALETKWLSGSWWKMYVKSVCGASKEYSTWGQSTLKIACVQLYWAFHAKNFLKTNVHYHNLEIAKRIWYPPFNHDMHKRAIFNIL